MRGGTGWWGVVLDAPDARALADFYAELLGWSVNATDEPASVVVGPVEGRTSYIAVQRSPEYVPPVWPAEDGRQQMMLHLDVGVHDLEVAVADAIQLGATLAGHQPQEDVRVLLDPAGHPFCLYLDR